MTQQISFAFAPIERPAPPPRQNLVIEAGAGTGKTTRIVAEVLRLMVSDENLAADRIVLVTFTEKAAGEIADRIRKGLHELSQALERGEAAWPPGSSNPLLVIAPADVERARKACARHVERIDSLRSQTIHSFCQSLLRAFHIEANLDPQFKIIEGFERQLLHDELYDVWIDDETRSRDETVRRDWELLFEQFNYLFQIRDMIFSLVERRDLLAEELSIGAIGEVEGRLYDAFGALRRTASDISDRETARVVEHAKSNELPGTGASLDEWLAWMRPIAGAMREAGIKGIRDKVVTEAVKVLREKKGDKSIYDRLLSHRSAEALLRIASRFVAFLDEEKRKRGVADFDDLLLRTDELLGIPAIRSRARAQFDSIFVDEFQDTDRTQARILTKLCTNDDGSWIEGRTIVVGDPKQSIYGFRRADPETYARMTRQMIDAGARRDEIIDQYRSDPPLLDAINTLFTTLLGTGSNDPNVFQPRYIDLRPGKSRSVRELDARITLLHAAAAEKEDRYIAEAESVAAWIQAHRDPAHHDLGRFAILFRRTTKLDDYLDVLDRHGIDYVLPPTRLFLDRRAAVDLLAVLRAIAYGFDTGAQVAAARTPYFALTDEEIARGVLREDGAWQAFTSAIAAFRAASSHLTVTQLVDLVIERCGIEAVYAKTVDHQRSLRHLEHLRTIAFTFDERSGGSVRQFVDQIAARREEPDEMEPSLTDETRNAVRIMTVHASKGLEFNTVIIPDLEFSGGGGGVQVFATESPESLVVSGQVESISGNFRDWNGERLKKVRAARDEAEMMRLFYVAVTRAESEVVFVLDETDGSTSTGFRKCVNALFGFDKSTPRPWPDEGRAIVTMQPGGRELPVAFERLPAMTGTAAARRRLIDADEEETFRNGVVVEPAVPQVDVSTPALPPGRLEQLRAGVANRTAGVLLHRFLEVWDSSADPDALLRRLATEAAADDAVSAKVRQRIAALRRSPASASLLGAEVIGREFPIRVVDETGRAVERRIDRLVRIDGRETVIDYKSGKADAERLEKDSAQVRAYCAAIRAMTGRECRGVLWYVDLERDRVIEVDAKVER